MSIATKGKRFPKWFPYTICLLCRKGLFLFCVVFCFFFFVFVFLLQIFKLFSGPLGACACNGRQMFSISNSWIFYKKKKKFPSINFVLTIGYLNGMILRIAYSLRHFLFSPWTQYSFNTSMRMVCYCILPSNYNERGFKLYLI